MSKIRKYGQSYSKFEKKLSEKGITPYRVATDLNISPMLLSDWKNDKSKPKLDTMILIANYLSMPVTDFSDLESEVE
jgi:transcriptional regulator with XRE-family HTH domain|uniref:Helix-turn-helix XRE-family like protein n=1 Tax=Siphoviridae sp. ct7EW56 TaxID=2827562 RepID=A0A8S5LRQ5_9CAUD|nr:MAG TPA: helix-turn-helix XRE-family like protein [Siphoviridae sp. ct7EW56]DAE38100.1 MAG TPA: Helix-turn-helix XRE-family like protein [Bacteriophage sp.]DAQ98083.1 MAG TPA: Helix-turn-helix XRE-family like protein [Caudoviricetes sp.]